MDILFLSFDYRIRQNKYKSKSFWVLFFSPPIKFFLLFTHLNGNHTGVGIGGCRRWRNQSYSCVKLSKSDQFIKRIKKAFNKCNRVVLYTSFEGWMGKSCKTSDQSNVRSRIRCLPYNHFQSVSVWTFISLGQLKEHFTHLSNPITTWFFRATYSLNK